MTLLRHPHLTPFLPNNFGRESGWVYYLIPYLLILGKTPFALRFAATTTGILTLAAIGRISLEMWGMREAFWNVAALAVFYWHVHLSHLALRANFYVLIGSLAAASLMHAYRVNHRRDWIVGGVLLGLLGYTYFASAGLIVYLGLIVFGIVVLSGRRRWGAALALVVAIVVLMPMGLYVLRHKDIFLVRPRSVIVDSAVWLLNARRWLGAWFGSGDPNHLLNLASRPILDALTGTLGIVGLLNMLVLTHRRSYGLMVVGWLLVTCLPSLLSDFAPHFLRASGMSVAVAIVIGQGGQLLQAIWGRLSRSNRIRWLPLLVWLPIAISTYRDFHGVWVHHPDTFMPMNVHTWEAVSFLRTHAPRDDYIYFSPFTPAHPVVAFYSEDLSPRPVSAFDGHECLVLPAHSAEYISLTVYEPGFQNRLAEWASVVPVLVDWGGSGGVSRYSVFAAEPYPNLGQYVATFGDGITVKLMRPISATAQPGDTVDVVLGIQVRRRLDFAPSVFVHLYGEITPYEGGPLWAQADRQVCVSYPAHLWRPEETIVQSFPLKLPETAPLGTYTIAIGIYPFPQGERLPVSREGNQDLRYVVLHTLTLGN